MAGPRVLMVCTANICRSPAAAVLLRRAVAPVLPEALIASAGTEAVAGRPACDLASALIGEFVASHDPELGPVTTDGHASRRVTLADLRGADLVLALDRSHRAALARLDPAGRPRTLTLRQAAAAASEVARSLSAGELPEGAPPVPAGAEERFRWWVAELDAGRAAGSGETAVLGPLQVDPLDVPDPHVVGYQFHPVAMELIEEAVGAIAESLAAVLRFGEAAA